MNWLQDPVMMRRINGWLTIFFILLIPVAIVTGWIRSVEFIAALSLWALVAGHWSAWQSARVEVEQQSQSERVVEALVAETTVERLDDP